MNPLLSRIVDGALTTGEVDDEEKMVEGVRDEAGGDRDSG
jgi:hypothetical protein